MDYQDEMKSVTVRVANGSGVIVQPFVDNFFYILTAYHVVKGKDIDQITLGFQSKSPLFGKTVKIQDIYDCEELDIAILIIERNGEEIISFYPCSDRQDGADHWHTGYPNNQNDTGKANSCKLHIFLRWLGSYDNNFVEYQYQSHINKKELDGMSGGGIFDCHHHLIGVHKQFAANEKKEELGKNVMIPWSCFEKLITENDLPPVAKFDLSSFKTFKEEIFSFKENRGAENKLKNLLSVMAQYRADILDISPLMCYDEFQKSRSVNNYKPGLALLKEDWVTFGEFVVALKAIWGLDVIDHLVDQVFPKFQYVLSANDFDFYDVTKQLDPSVLGIVSTKNVVFVVGGIQSKGYKQDVKNKDIPNIAVGLKPNEGFDIARGGQYALESLTFVNAHYFKDAMEANTDEIRDHKGEELEFYKNLINCRIWR